jgi:CRP-like cAMP-binding protein
MPDDQSADRRTVDGAARGTAYRSGAAPDAQSWDVPHEQERNWLLSALTPGEYESLASCFETVTLSVGQRLGARLEPIPFVYFPQSGVVSILKRMADGTEVEVGTVGAEGMSALAVFLGGDEMPTECVVQVAGSASRISAADLQAASGQGAPLHEVLRCYTQYLFDQVLQSVACDRLHSVEQRCARWLLTTYDRVGASEFALTQEHLAALLGVRRAGISVAAEALRRDGAITYSRGKIRIIGPARLEAAACECYRVTHEDFDRLLGRAGRQRRQPER